LTKRNQRIPEGQQLRAAILRSPCERGLHLNGIGQRFVLGLKWEDIDFIDRAANVLRSCVDGAIGPCKTEISQQPVPLDEIVIEELLAWRSVCPFGSDTDWVFGSRALFGKLPVWPDSLRTKILQPATKRAKITKRVGWHTFRHTHSTLLKANGEDVKVVQELMRHANITTTMNIYSRALTSAKRKAVDVHLFPDLFAK
jgi:integrase